MFRGNEFDLLESFSFSLLIGYIVFYEFSARNMSLLIYCFYIGLYINRSIDLASLKAAFVVFIVSLEKASALAPRLIIRWYTSDSAACCSFLWWPWMKVWMVSTVSLHPQVHALQGF